MRGTNVEIVMWRATRCGGWVRRWREGQRALLDGVETMSAPAFRANVGERLRSLERELAEVRTRVNGLLFVMAGTAVTQVLLRILA